LIKSSYGILASGNLGLICIEKIAKKASIKFVLTDKLSNSIIDYCHHNSLPVFIGNPRNGKAISFLSNYPVDVILSINYLFIVEKDIIDIPKKYAINFHGSLLPKYRGRTPHVWAIINNESETGITAHMMSEGCDEGDLVHQEKISISTNSTGADILNKYVEVYPTVISHVMEAIESGNIMLAKQDGTKATWFGKRTPEDGEINWAWQKERIFNWVRALARPYPGAFTFYQNNRIEIHRIAYSNHGFNASDENGKILCIDKSIIVKTENGAVELLDIVAPPTINFKIGEAFHGRY
jgi:methionyl-tRNA formyltransferase